MSKKTTTKRQSGTQQEPDDFPSLIMAGVKADLKKRKKTLNEDLLDTIRDIVYDLQHGKKPSKRKVQSVADWAGFCHIK